MDKIANLHLLHNSIFTEAYIVFINKNFSPNSHQFLVHKSDKRFKTTLSENVINADNKKNKWWLINKFIYQADKLILHGLFERNIILLLFLQPWLLKKTYWVVWGADLYQYREMKITIKAKILEKMRRYVIKNIGNICTLVYGDYELAKEWYGAEGRYFEAMYLSNRDVNQIENLKKISENYQNEMRAVKVLIGNSASKTNNHLDVFNRLSKFKDMKIEFICPLSYGDKEYAKSIIDYGYKVLGEKFIPLTNLLPYEEYIELLKKIDIGVFNNDRQQALGNIFELIELEKKVYLRRNTSMWHEIKNRLDIKVFDIDSIEKSSFGEFVSLDIKIKQDNAIKLKEYRSIERIIRIWSNIFES